MSAATSQRTAWTIDSTHSLAEFSVRHLMIANVKGRFRDIEGAVTADLSNLASAEIAATATVASIDTADAKRDDHLRSADFFAADEHPHMQFRSRSIVPAADGEYQVTADLTIRGVTRSVPFTLTFAGTGRDPWGNERAAFSLQGTVNRSDFGLNWNAALETGGFLVGDQVRIAIEIEAVRQAA